MKKKSGFLSLPFLIGCAANAYAEAAPEAPLTAKMECQAPLAQLSPGLSEDWYVAARDISKRFETSRSFGYDAVVGDGDQQGISVGILQWNIGAGTLRTLIKRMGAETDLAALAKETMPDYPEFLVRALAGVDERAAWLRYVRDQQKGGRLDERFKTQLSAFFGSQASVCAQEDLARQIANAGFTDAKKFATETSPTSAVRFAHFALFFDTHIQGGGGRIDDITSLLARTRESRGSGHLRAFRSYALSASGMVLLRDWERERPPESDWVSDAPDAYRELGALRCARPDGRRARGVGHTWDAAANCALWRRSIRTMDEDQPNNLLLVFSYVRALISRDEYALAVFNRKGSLAMGRGVVNGTYCDFRKLYASMDDREAYQIGMSDMCQTKVPAAHE